MICAQLGGHVSVFKEETETKRVIFNVRMDLAERLERAKDAARILGKKLDSDGAVDKALEKFLKRAERKLAEMGADLGDATASGQEAPAATEEDQKTPGGNPPGDTQQ
jgi:hypothetical protein